MNLWGCQPLILRPCGLADMGDNTGGQESHTSSGRRPGFGSQSLRPASAAEQHAPTPTLGLPAFRTHQWLQGDPAGSLCFVPTWAPGNPSFLITLLTFPVFSGLKDVLYWFPCSSHCSEYVRPKRFSHPDCKHSSVSVTESRLPWARAYLEYFYSEPRIRLLYSPELGENRPHRGAEDFDSELRLLGLRTADPRAFLLPALPLPRPLWSSSASLNKTQK